MVEGLRWQLSKSFEEKEPKYSSIMGKLLRIDWRDSRKEFTHNHLINRTAKQEAPFVLNALKWYVVCKAMITGMSRRKVQLSGLKP